MGGELRVGQDDGFNRSDGMVFRLAARKDQGEKMRANAKIYRTGGFLGLMGP